MRIHHSDSPIIATEKPKKKSPNVLRLSRLWPIDCRMVTVNGYKIKLITDSINGNPMAIPSSKPATPNAYWMIQNFIGCMVKIRLNWSPFDNVFFGAASVPNFGPWGVAVFGLALIPKACLGWSFEAADSANFGFWPGCAPSPNFGLLSIC